MRITPIFAWYDLWVGAYWDATNRRLYLLPIPTIGIVIDLKRPAKLKPLKIKRSKP